MTDNDSETQPEETPAAHQAEPAEEEPRRAWWAIPVALVGAFAVKYLARRGERAAPPAPEEKERIKDADFEVIE